MPRNDASDFGVEGLDVDRLSGVGLLDVAGDGYVVAVLGNVAVFYQTSEVGDVLAPGVGIQDFLPVLRQELVLVAAAHEFAAGINEQRGVIELGFLQHDDAGGNRGAEEQIWRELDHRVDIIVVDQVLADFLLRTAAIKHTREFDDSGRAIHRQPTEDVQGEGQIGLALGGEHAGRGETRIVDEQGIGVAIPFDRIRRIGNDGLERFVIPVRRIGQRVAVGDVELLVVHIVQEHVDAAQVVGGQVDFLPVEPLTYCIVAQDFGEVQQQRA